MKRREGSDQLKSTCAKSGVCEEPSTPPVQEASQLCQSLAQNTVLKELYASGHKMEPRTAESVAAMLRSNSTLESICVGDETFGDEVCWSPVESFRCYGDTQGFGSMCRG